MQNKSNENKLKQTKIASNPNAVATLKNSSRKKTLSSKDKSQNKKSRKIITKDKKISGNEQYDQQKQCNYQERNQYYTKQKCYDSHKSFSENISEHTLNGNKRYSDDSCYRKIEEIEGYDQYGTSPKIRLDSIKGVISFDGKLVKNQVKEENFEKKKHHTRWEISSREYTTEIYNDKPVQASKSQRKGGKSQSKGKNMRKKQNKSKSKVINNIPEFLTEKQADELKKLNLKDKKHQASIKNKTSRDQESEETICTPNLNQYERNQQIDIFPLKEEIAEEEKWSNDHKTTFLSMKKILYEQRCMCINMVSKICGQLKFKKETFGLSIQIFDLYLSDQVLFRKMKILALSCLELALKLEQAQNSHNFIVQINSICKKKNGMSPERQHSQAKKQKQNRRSNTSRDKSKKKGLKKKTAEDLKAELFFKKQKLMTQIIKEQIPEEELNRMEMLEFQTLIALKFEFKLWKKTFAYWIDILTLIWDQFLLNDNQFYHNVDAIIFRCPANPKNISYLIQILEAGLYSPQIYEYSKTILVLSVMYMLVRINMEGGNESAYEAYKKALTKSSNVLFIDRVGCNVLFGTFLLKLEIEMGAILSCCQFISNYLDLNPLSIFPYPNNQTISRNYDQNLSYHFYNSSIYLHYGK